MKPTLFATAAAILLVTSATSNAGNGYFTELGRNLGYGISDGYHAQRYCLPACAACSSGSLMPQPMMAPTPAPWAPQQFHQTGYPIGYPAVPMYQPWRQRSASGYGQTVMPSLASPARSPVLHW